MNIPSEPGFYWIVCEDGPSIVELEIEPSIQRVYFLGTERVIWSTEDIFKDIQWGEKIERKE